MTSTPPLSIDEKALDLDEEPLDIFSMKMPDCDMIARQQTDLHHEPTTPNIQSDDQKINKNDDEFTMPPLPDLQFGQLLARQRTDDANNKNDDDDDDEFAMPPLTDLGFSGLTRQKTDDTPNNEANPNDDDDDNNKNQSPSPAMPPLNDIILSGLTRQKTDDTPNNEEAPTNADDLDIPSTGFAGITRQKTDNANNNNNDNNDVVDMAPLNDLILSGLTKQRTDIHHNNDNQQQEAQQIDDELGNELPGFGALRRQQTDMTDNNDEKVEEKDNLDSLLIADHSDDIGGDVFGSLPTLNDIARQRTDAAASHDKQMMIDQMDCSLNDESIKYLPPRVSHDNDNDNDVPSKPVINNQYLDTNLVMFDDKGKLFDIDNEQFISLNKDEDDTENSPQEIQDDSINQFIEHKDAIICIAFNPKKSYEVCSGSQDENCYIWDIINYDSSQQQSIDKNEEKKTTETTETTRETRIRSECGYFEMNDHSDTIMDISWNSSGKFLGTASMDGCIKIYNYNKKMKLISSLDIGNEIQFIEWHPNINEEKKYRNILMAGCMDKNVWMYQYNKTTKKFDGTQILSGHSAEIECGGFTKYNNGKYGYSADKDGMIIIWENIIECDPYLGKKKYSFKPLIKHNEDNIGLYHDGSINAIDDCLNAPLLISGSCDFSVCLINYENGKILKKLGKHSDSVECVKFNKLYKQEIKYTNYASSSSLDGIIKIWDLNNGKIRNELPHDDGVIVHEWFNTENNANLIVSGCMNGIVYVWDSRNKKTIKQFKGHGKCSIQTLKISNDDKYIVSGADDSIAMVWKL